VIDDRRTEEIAVLSSGNARSSPIDQHLRAASLGFIDVASDPLLRRRGNHGTNVFTRYHRARYIDHARRTRKGAFIVSDATHVELPDGRFNQILIFGLLHHLPDAEVRKVLAECRRLLSTGGRVLVIEDIPAVSRLNLIGHLIHRVENGEFIRPVEDYRRLYAEAGRVDRELVLQSGICDYYAAVLVTT